MIQKEPGRRAVHAFCGAAALALGAAAAAQPSHTCEFALTGWLGTEVELEEARAAYPSCIEARTTS